MIDIHTELLLLRHDRIDEYTEWQMLRHLKEFQDALDEVPNADPYEHYIKLFDVKNGDGIAIGKGR